jgi:hypothetical protein
VTVNEDTRLVDMTILADVHEVASLQLALVRDRERRELGAPRTTLAEVARTAVLNWRPPKNAPATPVKRPFRRGKAEQRFRFNIGVERYDAQKAAMEKAGVSVTGVVQSALEKFGRTGRF